MSKNRLNNVRSRDDSHLQKLVSETRKWMKTEGIEERDLDWEAVAREEEALWWRERLQQALTDLAARSHEFAESIAARLRQLAAAAESQAEAALEVILYVTQQVGRVVGAENFKGIGREVTLDVKQVGRVLFEPARHCLRSGATLQFSYAPSALRSRLSLPESDEESIGLFISSTIPGARVIADARQRAITIEFWDPVSTPLVVLVPEDPALVPYVAEALKTNDTTRAIFDDLQPGRYLLSIYISEGG